MLYQSICDRHAEAANINNSIFKLSTHVKREHLSLIYLGRWDLLACWDAHASAGVVRWWSAQHKAVGEFEILVRTRLRRTRRRVILQVPNMVICIVLVFFGRRASII